MALQSGKQPDGDQIVGATSSLNIVLSIPMRCRIDARHSTTAPISRCSIADLPTVRPSFITRVLGVVLRDPILDRLIMEFSGCHAVTGGVCHRDYAVRSDRCNQSPNEVELLCRI